MYKQFILSPSISDTSKYKCDYWTHDQVHNAMNCPADITCFGASRDTALRDFQADMQTTRTEERFMAFCHTENLTLSTTRKLYRFLREEEFDHRELTHSDYTKLHQGLKERIPDEYSFKMVPLKVGKMYGVTVDVVNENNQPVSVPVRNLWKVLCLLFSDPRYQGYLDTHPVPIFKEGPDSNPERAFCGWASCKYTIWPRQAAHMMNMVRFMP
jgi:hypothetical protein